MGNITIPVFIADSATTGSPFFQLTLHANRTLHDKAN
jgi:hypothetical protein